MKVKKAKAWPSAAPLWAMKYPEGCFSTFPYACLAIGMINQADWIGYWVTVGMEWGIGMASTCIYILYTC